MTVDTNVYVGHQMGLHSVLEQLHYYDLLWRLTGSAQQFTDTGCFSSLSWLNGMNIETSFSRVKLTLTLQ